MGTPKKYFILSEEPEHSISFSAQTHGFESHVEMYTFTAIQVVFIKHLANAKMIMILYYEGERSASSGAEPQTRSVPAGGQTAKSDGQY